MELLSSNSPVDDTPWGAQAVTMSVPVSEKCARSVEEVGAQAQEKEFSHPQIPNWPDLNKDF